MNTGPLTTDALVQLMTATGLPADAREWARRCHRDDEPVTLTQEPDFTFTLAFVNGESLRLSYEQGTSLSKLLAS